MKKQTLWTRDFTMVVLGQIISLFGNAILRFALPLYLLDQTGSAALFGIVSACSFLPMIVLSPVGGIVADRVNKRNIMVALDFATAALIALLSAALGRVPTVPLLLAALMLLYGIAGAYQPTVQASLPALVREEKLLGANAVINQVNALAGLLGPIIGGVLYGTRGLAPVLALSTVCFVLSAVMEIFIRIPFVRLPRADGILATARADLSQSLHFMRREKPVILRVCVLICGINLFLSALIVIGVPVLVRQTLGLSSALLGAAQGAMGVGSLLGGVLAGVLGARLQIARAHLPLLVCAGCLVPLGLVLLVGAPIGLQYAVLALMSLVMMAAATLFTVQMLAFVQQETPQALLGKVISCVMALSMCAQPVGQALYGALLERFAGTPWVVVLAGAGASLLVALAARRTFRALAPRA